MKTEKIGSNDEQWLGLLADALRKFIRESPRRPLDIDAAPNSILELQALINRALQIKAAAGGATDTEQLYQQILDAVGVMILVKEEHSRIYWANKTFRDYYGMSNDELRDLVDAPFNEPDYTAQYVKDDLYVFTTGETLEIRAEPVTRWDGVVRYWDTVKSPILDRHGRIRFTVGVSLDVTDKKNAEEELRQATARAKAALRAQTNFLALMSHELRTPLTLILGPLESLLEMPHGLLSDSVRRQLELMHRNGAKLHRLVSEVLELARIEAGKSEPRLEPVSPKALLAEIVEEAQPGAEHEGLSLSLAVEHEFEPILIDRAMFETIVVNLISNALKFTPRGGRIDVHLAAQGDKLVLSVQDTGIGIPEEKQALIFVRFQQLDESSTRRYAGTGIGLALVKEFAELLGGRVSVESQVGQGTRFIVELPRRVDSNRVSVEVPRRAPTWRPRQKTSEKQRLLLSQPPADNRPIVLFVEDSADMRIFVKEVLESEYDVQLAENGKQALAALQRFQPDVIITDVMMPEMDGMELIAHLKHDQNLKRIPTLVLTARASREELIFVLRAGADDYLAKPFGPDELRARVLSAYRMRRMSRELENKSTELAIALDRERAIREELIQTSKMAAIGTLVSGLAHELNNPLAAILMYAKSLRLRTTRGADDIPTHALESIERQAQRCAQLVAQLLDFVHKRPMPRTRILLRIVLEAIEKLAQAQANQLKVDLTVDAGDADSQTLEVDIASFETALLNLISNGLQATRPGGRVRVWAHRQIKQNRGGVLVTVTDDGMGIAPEVLSRIFDPFFTTKAPGAGTGLGLSLVRTFVDNHDGHIEVTSAVGKGTSISLWLPCSYSTATEEKAIP